MDTRITELLALAASEGITLPYSPEFIVTQEDAGHVVDLTTGAIVLGGADARVVALRPLRQAQRPKAGSELTFGELSRAVEDQGPVGASRQARRPLSASELAEEVEPTAGEV